MFANDARNPINLDNLRNRVIFPALNRCVHCHKSEQAHKAAAKHKRWRKPDHAYERDESLPSWHGYHAFRRALATNLHDLGVEDLTIQAIMRHSDVSVTRRCYIKRLPKHVTAAVEQFGEAIQQQLGDQVANMQQAEQEEKPATAHPLRSQ